MQRSLPDHTHITRKIRTRISSQRATTDLRLRRRRHQYQQVITSLKLLLSFPSWNTLLILSPTLAVSRQTLITINRHVFLTLSYSFLSSGWLMTILFYGCFLPLWKSQNVLTHCQKNLTFIIWKNLDFRDKFSGVLGQKYFILINPRSSAENWDESDPHARGMIIVFLHKFQTSSGAINLLFNKYRWISILK